MSSLRNLTLAAAAATIATFSFAQMNSLERGAENAAAEIRQESAEAVNATENAAERTGAAIERAGENAAAEVRQEGAEAVNATENAAERTEERVETNVERSTDAVGAETAATTTTEVEVEQQVRVPRADRN